MIKSLYSEIKDSRKDFPIFQNNPNLVYLDNAASTQVPSCVITKTDKYYREYKANVHRSFYSIASIATNEYETAREKIATYIGAEANEIIFTKNSTESLNLIAYSLLISKKIDCNSNICLSEIEHHSNLVQWLILSKYTGCSIKYIELIKNRYSIDYDSFNNICKENKISILTLAHQSNITGLTLHLKKIHSILKDNKQNPIIILDASQSVPHGIVNVQELQVDAIAFTGHKLLGPTGIGVLWMKKTLSEELQPAFGGGEMVDKVTRDDFIPSKPPHKFEAGTPNISGAIGLGEAITYIEKFNKDEILEHENTLKNYLLERLTNIKEVKTIVPIDVLYRNHLTQIAFYLDKIHAHDIAQFLGEHNICIRAGYHCSQVIFNKYAIPATVRVSLFFYNTKDDIDKFITCLVNLISFF